MYKNKITQALLMARGFTLATASISAPVVDVPAGTKLATETRTCSW
ncbi:hypothetical protein ACLKMH_18760 [Psychromonas sp. KJ10-10]